MNFQTIAEYIGYVMMVAGTICFTSVFLWFLGFITYKASNRFLHFLVDIIGGWETFLEYRDWYHKNKK